MKFGKRSLQVTALALAAPLLFTACSSKASEGGTTAEGKTVVSLWTHAAGNPNEMPVLEKIISDFNASQTKYTVEKQDFPQEAYNDSIKGAAASDDLPCILDVDGPIMPNWAWNGWMVPTGLTDADVEGFLPSTVGKYDGQIYSVGYWEATTLMYTLKSVLTANDIRVPTVDQPWTAAEFADAEAKIKASGKFKYVIDYGPGWTGEWWPYAFSTLLQSFGGDLVNRDTYESADGVLNGAEAAQFATWFQKQFTDGYAPKSNAQDRTEFLTGAVAIQFNGNWGYSDNAKKYGDDLLVIPAPDFGKGTKAGAGSWQYGMSKSCTGAAKDGALEYLKFALDDKYIAQWSDATALIPATDAAAALTTKGLYGAGEPLEVASKIAQKYAFVRPVTPAYPVISQVFEKQMADIVNGKDPVEGLNQMVKEIDADIKSAGYQK